MFTRNRLLAISVVTFLMAVTLLLSCGERTVVPLAQSDAKDVVQGGTALDGSKSTGEVTSKVNEPFCYPLIVGQRWEYSGATIMYNFQPPEIGAPDTVLRSSQVVVAGRKLINGHRVYRLHETMTQQGQTYQSDTYFDNHKEGLFYYGCSAPFGSSVAPLKNLKGAQFAFGGQRFSSMEDLLDLFRNASSGSTDSPSLDEIHDPPLQSLKYPPQIGDLWKFRPLGEPFRIDKEIVSLGPVQVPAGTFQAFEVLWLYDLDGVNGYDGNVTLTDLISREGLLSRTVNVYRIIVSDYTGEILGTCDATEEWKLLRISKVPVVASAEIDMVDAQ